MLGAGLLLVSVAAVAATTFGSGQSDGNGAPESSGASAWPAQSSAYDPVADGIARWDRLRQSDGFGFSDYASFLLAYPGWPGELAMRKAAEKRIDAASFSPPQVASFFDRFPPLTGSGPVSESASASPTALARRATA